MYEIRCQRRRPWNESEVTDNMRVWRPDWSAVLRDCGTRVTFATMPGSGRCPSCGAVYQASLAVTCRGGQA